MVHEAFSKEFTTSQLIHLNWSLIQLEQAQDPEKPLINLDSLNFLKEITLPALSPQDFLLYKQLIHMACLTLEDFDLSPFSAKFSALDANSTLPHLLSADSARATSTGTIEEVTQNILPNLLKTLPPPSLQIQPNAIDDMLNLVEVTLLEGGEGEGAHGSKGMIQIVFENQKSKVIDLAYQHPSSDPAQIQEPPLRRTFEIKVQLMEAFLEIVQMSK